MMYPRLSICSRSDPSYRAVIEHLESRWLLSIYNGSPSGSDSIRGLADAPSLILQKAVDSMVAGNTVIARAESQSLPQQSPAFDSAAIPQLAVGQFNIGPRVVIPQQMTLTLGGSQTSVPGGTVNVPVTVSDDAYGLAAADLAITYNSTLLHLANADVTLNSDLAASGWVMMQEVNDVAGVIRISLFTGSNPILQHGIANVLNLTFHVPLDAVPGTAGIAIDNSINPSTGDARSRLNEGQLLLSPVAGAIVIDSAVLNVGSSSVVLNSPGSFSVLTIAPGGRLRVAAGGANLLQVATLNISPGGILDLADNDLVLTTGGPTSFATLRQYLGDGRLITSVTEPAPGHFATLAEADNQMLHLSVFDGTTINDGTNFSQVIIKHTWVGDTNLDGKVTQEDYLNVIAHLGQSGQWILGDLNGDGMVTADDLAMVSSNMGAGVPVTPGPSQAGIQTIPTAGLIVPAKSVAARAKPIATSRTGGIPLVKPKPVLLPVKPKTHTPKQTTRKGLEQVKQLAIPLKKQGS